MYSVLKKSIPLRIGGNKVNTMSMYNAVRFVFSCAIVCEKKESGGHSIVRLIALSDELYKRDYSQEKEGGKRRRERKRERREKDPDPFNNDLFPGIRTGM